MKPNELTFTLNQGEQENTGGPMWSFDMNFLQRMNTHLKWHLNEHFPFTCIIATEPFFTSLIVQQCHKQVRSPFSLPRARPSTVLEEPYQTSFHLPHYWLCPLLIFIYHCKANTTTS